MDRRPSLSACANANGGLVSIPAARNRMCASSFLCHHSGETECVSKKCVPLPLHHLSSRQARTGQPDHLPRCAQKSFDNQSIIVNAFLVRRKLDSRMCARDARSWRSSSGQQPPVALQRSEKWLAFCFVRVLFLFLCIVDTRLFPTETGQIKDDNSCTEMMVVGLSTRPP